MNSSDFENKLITAKYALIKVEQLFNSRTDYSKLALHDYLRDALVATDLSFPFLTRIDNIDDISFGRWLRELFLWFFTIETLYDITLPYAEEQA